MGYAARANPLSRAVHLGGFAGRQDKIAVLAGRIADEAELERIVQRAKPALRDAVRRYLIPHLRFEVKETYGPEVEFVTPAVDAADPGGGDELRRDHD